VSPDDPYTFIYTSGTTGPPKGVVLTHGNCASVGVMVQELGFVTEEDVSYLYLPLAHSFALTVQLASIDVGSAIAYFGGNPKEIVAELQDVKPTYFPSVPRIFEKIYTLATAGADDQEKLRQAVELGVRVRRMEQRGEKVPEGMRTAFEKAERRSTGTSARCLAAGSTRPSLARRRSRRRSSGSSTPAASRCSRAGG
jgi:long-chain acyl-CoA synthetase